MWPHVDLPDAVQHRDEDIETQTGNSLHCAKAALKLRVSPGEQAVSKAQRQASQISCSAVQGRMHAYKCADAHRKLSLHASDRATTWQRQAAPQLGRPRNAALLMHEHGRLGCLARGGVGRVARLARVGPAARLAPGQAARQQLHQHVQPGPQVVAPACPLTKSAPAQLSGTAQCSLAASSECERVLGQEPVSFPTSTSITSTSRRIGLQSKGSPQMTAEFKRHG